MPELIYLNHVSLNNHLPPLISTKNNLKKKHGHIEKLRSLSKVQRKMDNFFLKEFKKIMKPLDKSKIQA